MDGGICPFSNPFGLFTYLKTPLSNSYTRWEKKSINLKLHLARICHKGRRQRPEKAMNADGKQSETFEKQRKKVRRHTEIFRGILFTL